MQGFSPLTLGSGLDWGSMSSLGSLGSTPASFDPSFLQAQITNLLGALNGSSSLASSTSETSSTPAKPKTAKERKELEEKIEALQGKLETATEEVKKAETNLNTTQEAQKADDGKEYKSGSFLSSVGKGIKGFFTNLVMTTDEKGEKHVSVGKALLTGAAVVVGGLALTALAPVAVPLLGGVTVGGLATAAGVGLGAHQVIKGAINYSEAKTFKEKDLAVQEATEGGIGLALTGAVGIVGKLANFLKFTKAANTVADTTEGLKVIANGAGKLKAVASLLESNGLAENKGLAGVLAKALKIGEVPVKRHLAKVSAAFKMYKKGSGELYGKLGAAFKAGMSEADEMALGLIQNQVEVMAGSAGNARKAAQAREALSALFRQTSKANGISPQLEAALAEAGKTPEVGKLLKLTAGSASSVSKTVTNLQGKDLILKSLARITPSEANQALIAKATELLNSLSSGGANRKELMAVLNELNKAKLIDGGLLSSAADSIRLTLGGALTSGARGAVSGVKSAPGRVRNGVASLATTINENRTPIALGTATSGAAFTLLAGKMNRAATLSAQETILAEHKKEVNAKNDALAAAKNKELKLVQKLATLNGIGLKNEDRKEAKTTAELISELEEVKADKATAQKALAEAEKAEKEKAAA